MKLHTDEEIPKDYALEPLQLSEEIVVFSEDADRSQAFIISQINVIVYFLVLSVLGELMIEGKISKRVDMRATDDVAVRSYPLLLTRSAELQQSCYGC